MVKFHEIDLIKIDWKNLLIWRTFFRSEILIESFPFFPHPYAAFLVINVHRRDGRKVVFFCAKIPTSTIQFFGGEMRQLLRENVVNLRPPYQAGGRC